MDVYMCGRFTLATTADQFHDTYGLQPGNLPPRYNIAPTQGITVVTSPEDIRQVDTMRWGLILRWAKDSRIGNQCINARAETVLTKPAFSQAVMQHRCLIPTSGFYEWTDQGKRAWWIAAEEGLLTMAGIWKAWNSPQGVLHSCAILTTSATPQISVIHDRMPLFISPEDFYGWLDTTTPMTPVKLRSLVDAGKIPLKIQEVSTRVNNVHEDDAALLDPYTAAQGRLF